MTNTGLTSKACSFCNREMYTTRTCYVCELEFCYMCCVFMGTGKYACDQCVDYIWGDTPQNMGYSNNNGTTYQSQPSQNNNNTPWYNKTIIGGIKRFFGRGNKSSVNYTTTKPKPPDARDIIYNGLPIGEDFNPSINRDVYLEMVKLLFANHKNEIAGFAVYDEEQDTIVWTYRDESAEEQGAHVNSNSAPASMAARLAGYRPPNCQWHTHPGMTDFFSVTDTRDQIDLVTRASKVNPKGYYIFIVFDRGWAVNRIDWEDGELVSLRKGHVMLDGVPLLWDRLGKHYSFNDINYGHTVWEPSTSAITYSKLYGDMYGNQLSLPITAPSPTEEDDTFAAQSGAYYMGNWSDDPKEYLPLFNVMDVQPYRWTELYETILELFGAGNYWYIVNNTHCWPDLEGWEWEGGY